MTISGKARLAGVMGWPVSHSMSPRLHNFWIERHGIDGAYVPLPVRPEHFDDAVRALATLGFAGVNVTLPHKQAALAMADRVEPLAARIGAANTLIFDVEGTIEARNTDAFGFAENLRASEGSDVLRRGPAVLVGAGGSARAVVAALQDAGVPEIRIVNRTRAKAEELVASFGKPCVTVEWDQRAAALDGATLLVNATTQGMQGQPPLDLALDALPRDAVVTDLVYVPLETPLLAAARARGNRTVDGLGMLLYQALAGFSAWFGVGPMVDEALRRFVLAGLAGG
jgi:shikimate dehydrogenase